MAEFFKPPPLPPSAHNQPSQHTCSMMALSNRTILARTPLQASAVGLAPGDATNLCLL